MRLFFLFLFISYLFLVNSVTLAQDIQLGSGENMALVKALRSDGFILEMELNSIQFKKMKYDYDFYYLPHIDGYGKGLETGNPQLPVYRKLIEIPAGASYSVKVTRMHYQIYNLDDYNIDYPIFPTQESMEKREDAVFVFRKNDAVYKKNAFYSEPLYSISILGSMRDVQIARLSVAPVEYNPVKNQLKIYDELELEIVFDFNQAISGQERKHSPAFMQTRKYLLNGQAYAAHQPPLGVQYPLKMVIVADSSFRNALKPFIKWKEQQGYKIIEAYTSDTAVGHTRNSIKNYLKNLYLAGTPLDPAPSYVLLVGDVAQIPKYPGLQNSWPADLYYCEYTGDYFPEVMYGRFSANDTSELNPQIEKTIAYEKYQMASSSYLDTSILISGNDAGHAPTYGDGQVNYGTANYFNVGNNIYCRSYLYVNQSYTKDLEIRQYADTGAAFINYTAHGLASGWKDPYFRVQNVATMKNKGKYPLMVGNACLTNKFDIPECFGEALLRARNKGAIGYIGASDNTLWDEDYYWAVGYGIVSANPTYQNTTDGLYDLMFHTHNEPYNMWAITAYQYLQAGNMAVTQGGSNVRRYWELYHLMGDPSLMPYLNQATPITANYNPLLPLGLNNFVITTEPYALVALSHADTLVASNYADSTGQATLYFPPFTQSVYLDLVITATRKIPYFSTVTAASPNMPYLIYSSRQIVDTNGNSNGMADYNEQVHLDMSFTNISTHQADSCYAHLRTNDSSVNLLDTVFYLGNVTANDTVNFTNVFSYRVASNVEDGHIVKFEVFITDSAGRDWSSFFYDTLYAPNIKISKVIIDDSQNGNGNGRIDPGESFSFNIPLHNRGSLFADSVLCKLTTGNGGVTINNSPILIDTILVNGQQIVKYNVSVANSFKTGDVLHFDFNYGFHGRNDTLVLNQVVGYVGEDFETGDFSKFKWELSSTYPWIVQNTYVHQGNYSAASATNLPNEDTSSLFIAMHILEDDSIVFYQRVSTEYNYDFAYFYIDGRVQERSSGNIPWRRKAFAVKKGLHTFKWSYIKDNFSTDYLDAVFLDDIAFPPTDAWTNVENAEQELQSIQLMPNPAREYSILRFDLNRDAKADIVLYDANGRLIENLQTGYQLYKGQQEVRIATHHLKAGIYFIGIQTNEGSWFKRLIVVND